jgi:carbonic anhydrase
MAIDDLLAHAEEYAREQGAPDLPIRPARKLAVVACMDSRLDVFAILGLQPGEAHVIRNAGGVVTDDVIRSLALSQRLLGTEEVVLIHHTDCGLLKVTEDEFREELRRETGQRPTWPVEAFTDLDEDVRASMARLRATPFVPNVESVRGFVFEVETGRLREILAR